MAKQSDLISARGKSSLKLDPIVIPPFDNSDLVASYDLTLMGRVLNPEMQAHRVRALIALMPQAWNLEGRVQGMDLGRGKFQFRFQSEEELNSVLEKRPFFFDQWMFPLERWVPSVRVDFPSTMLFWIHIDGIPPHYLKEQTVKSIGEKLGDLIQWEVNPAKVRVLVECENPLQFERLVQFSSTGDEVVVTFRYEKLEKFCFICQRISHDGRHCPDLEREQRAFKSKQGNKRDWNQKQQAILKGEEGPYRRYGKSERIQDKQKPSVRRELFSQKETQPERNQGRLQGKQSRESTKSWVERSFGEKSTKSEKSQDHKSSARGASEIVIADVDKRDTVRASPKGSGSRNTLLEEKKKLFKPASWYRDPSSGKGKSASDPGKSRKERSPSLSANKRSQVEEGKIHVSKPPVSTGSQVMDTNSSCDLEEVISPMKEMMTSNSQSMSESLDDRGGRRGKPIRSRLGPRSNVSLQVKKKIIRSPTKGLMTKK
ncbi:hypothetical protein EUTSA_v10009587mg [Eutrema salsugineum]|uniref:DUF4283 domain-containing protein n=1 Tax=Eutrema salsugineum TaxID=72664 RepID=V4MRN8_EUTSA|nr:hypothetical protein EUTSA_v10009587mg [Eutrema salsugineum]